MVILHSLFGVTYVHWTCSLDSHSSVRMMMNNLYSIAFEGCWVGGQHDQFFCIQINSSHCKICKYLPTLYILIMKSRGFEKSRRRNEMIVLLGEKEMKCLTLTELNPRTMELIFLLSTKFCRKSWLGLNHPNQI